MTKSRFAVWCLACFAVLAAVGCLSIHHEVDVNFKRPDWLPKGGDGSTIIAMPVGVINSNGDTTQPSDIQTPDEILDEIINKHGGTP